MSNRWKKDLFRTKYKKLLYMLFKLLDNICKLNKEYRIEKGLIINYTIINLIFYIYLLITTYIQYLKIDMLNMSFYIKMNISIISIFIISYIFIKFIADKLVFYLIYKVYKLGYNTTIKEQTINVEYPYFYLIISLLQEKIIIYPKELDDKNKLEYLIINKLLTYFNST